MALVRKYWQQAVADAIAAAATAKAMARLAELDATESDERHFMRLAAAILYTDARWRADPTILAQNLMGQSGLWRYAISGDLPIVLLNISTPRRLKLVSQLAHAHRYWQVHGLAVDLVILGGRHDEPPDGLHGQIVEALVRCGNVEPLNRPGGIFACPGDTVPTAERILLQTVARIVIDGNAGPLARQLAERSAMPASLAAAAVWPPRAGRSEPPASPLPADPPGARATAAAPIFPNGVGGLTADGREYVVPFLATT